MLSMFFPLAWREGRARKFSSLSKECEIEPARSLTFGKELFFVWAAMVMDQNMESYL